MWHKPCRTFHPWCPCIKTRCLFRPSKADFSRQPCDTGVILISQTATALGSTSIRPYSDAKLSGRCLVNVDLRAYTTLRWRHNERDGVSNYRRLECSFNRLFRCRSRKTSKLCVTGLGEGNSPGPVNSPHKGPVTWEIFPFDDVIMIQWDTL